MCNTSVVGVVRCGEVQLQGGYSTFTSILVLPFILWRGGRGLDQHGRLPCCAVLRYDVPTFGFGVAFTTNRSTARISAPSPLEFQHRLGPARHEQWVDGARGS